MTYLITQLQLPWMHSLIVSIFFPGMLEIHEKDTVVSGISHVDYLEIKNNAVGYFFWFGC